MTNLKNKLNPLLALGRGHFPSFRFPIIVVGYTGKKMIELATWQNILLSDTMHHLITVNLTEMTSLRDCYEAILHELVHAWQYEQNPLETNHDDNFLQWVVYFGRLGYNISCPDFTVEQLEQAFNTRRIA